MTWKKILILAVGVGLLLAPASASAQGSDENQVVVEPPRQVTGNPDPLRLFDIPALAVHPDDPSTVVMAVGDARNGGCGLRVSRDGGLSWVTTAPTLLPAELSFCHQRPLFPVMAPAFASDGTLYVAMPGSSPATGHPNGPISMLLARTDDLGVTHETITVAESKQVTVDPADYGGEGEPEEGNLWHKAPSLVVDPNNPNKLYLGYRWSVWGTDLQGLSGDVPSRPYVSVSEDGGETWSDPIDLVESASGVELYGSSAPMLVVDPDGTVYGFSKESVGPQPEGQPRPNARTLVFKSTDGGGTWETKVLNEGGENMRSPQPAVDPRNGALYVVYGSGGAHAAAGEPPPAPQEIYFTASKDDAESWSEPVKISVSQDGPADKFEPGISVAPDGRIDVAWHDFRNDPFGSGQIGAFFRGERYWDVYYAYSDNSGATWSPNLRVTETFIDGGEGATFNNKDVRGPLGIASTSDAAYVAWADSRATGREGDAEDAYFSRIRFASPGELAGNDAGNSRWLWGLAGAGAGLAVAGLVLVLGMRRVRAGRSGATEPVPTGA